MKTFRIATKTRRSMLSLAVTTEGFQGTKFDAMEEVMWSITHYHLERGKFDQICSLHAIMLSVAEDARDRNHQARPRGP